MDIFSLAIQHLGVLLLIFIRLIGLFTAAPFFGSRNIPVYAKIGLSLLMAYILFPLVFSTSLQVPDTLLPFMLTAVGEVIIGLTFGFASSLVFSAVQMAGQILDIQIGFGIVNVIDPQSGQQVPLVGNFKYLLALMIFLATNSHHLLIVALFSSFKIVPLTGVAINAAGLTQTIIDMVGDTFVIAAKISLPVLAALLITDVGIGILARLMPQMNIFIVGQPGKIIVGIFVLSLALPFYLAFLEVAFGEMYRGIYRVLAGMH